MKNLIMTLIALIALNVQAQEEHNSKEHARRGQNMTPEQMAIMRTKQLTLALDLNDSQQNELLALNQKNAASFKAIRGDKKELTQEERFEIKNKMLDHQIATQREMKTILNEEQYGKWRKMQHMRQAKMSKKRGQAHRGKRGKKGEHAKKG